MSLRTTTIRQWTSSRSGSTTGLYINIFIGYEPFNNEPLKSLSAIATNVTNFAYWQLDSIFKRLPRDRSLHNVPVRIGIQVAMPRLQRKSYSPRIFQQCRALKHQTAIVTPFWAWGNVCFAKRTAPSGGMREMCINNIIRHLLSSVGTCSWTSASITSILQSTKIFFNM